MAGFSLESYPSSAPTHTHTHKHAYLKSSHHNLSPASLLESGQLADLHICLFSPSLNASFKRCSHFSSLDFSVLRCYLLLYSYISSSSLPLIVPSQSAVSFSSFYFRASLSLSLSISWQSGQNFLACVSLVVCQPVIRVILQWTGFTQPPSLSTTLGN